MNITVIGCGRWGSFLSWYFDSLGHQVKIYGREGSRSFSGLREKRANEYVTLSEHVSFTSDLCEALSFSEYIIISINAQNTPDLFQSIANTQITDKTFVLCMKGLIESSGARLSEVARAALGDKASIAVWVGPGHVEDFTKHIPNCMLICSDQPELAKKLCKEFSSNLIRFYFSSDMIGNEIGAATKNVMGIAAGMLDGLSLSTLKGALMARGTHEISKLIKAMGGNELTAYGLSHLGDYEATLFSEHSHNRMFGEDFIRGIPYNRLAEGVSTVKALMVLKEKYAIDLPISTALYRLIYEHADPQSEMNALFLRPIKDEFSTPSSDRSVLQTDKIQKEERKFVPSTIMEGFVSIKAIISAHKNGTNNRRIKKIWFDQSKIQKKERELQFLKKNQKQIGYDLEFCDAETIERFTTGTSHGGIIAFCTERTLNPLTPDAIKDNGFYVMVEGIEDPYNFGYALRSLYAAGVDGIVLSPRNWMTAAGVVARASAGASELFNIVISSGENAADLFHDKGYSVIYADEKAEQSVYKACLKKPIFLLVGGEKRGISAALRQKCDKAVKLDYGREFRNSLSAASAASILAFEIYRQNS